MRFWLAVFLASLCVLANCQGIVYEDVTEFLTSIADNPIRNYSYDLEELNFTVPLNNLNKTAEVRVEFKDNVEYGTAKNIMESGEDIVQEDVTEFQTYIANHPIRHYRFNPEELYFTVPLSHRKKTAVVRVGFIDNVEYRAENIMESGPKKIEMVMKDNKNKADDERKDDEIKANDERNDDEIKDNDERTDDEIKANDERTEDEIKANDERKDDEIKANEKQEDVKDDETKVDIMMNAEIMEADTKNADVMSDPKMMVDEKNYEDKDADEKHNNEKKFSEFINKLRATFTQRAYSGMLAIIIPLVFLIPMAIFIHRFK
jgi:hypothetical protein